MAYREFEVSSDGVRDTMRQVDGVIENLAREVSGHAALAVPNAFGQLGQSVAAATQSAKRDLDQALSALAEARTKHNRTVQQALEQNYEPTDRGAAGSFGATEVPHVPHVGQA